MYLRGFSVYKLIEGGMHCGDTTTNKHLTGC